MKKTIATSVISLFVGIIATLFVIYATDFYKLRVVVMNDHNTLMEVVKLLNNAKSQTEILKK